MEYSMCVYKFAHRNVNINLELNIIAYYNWALIIIFSKITVCYKLSFRLKRCCLSTRLAPEAKFNDWCITVAIFTPENHQHN